MFNRYRLAMLVAVVALVALYGGGSTAFAQPERSPVVATLRGSYNGFSVPKVEGPVSLHAGLVVVRARHNGTANFVINLRLPDPGTSPDQYSPNTYLLVDAVGRYDGAAAVVVPKDGDYYLVLAAGGAYEITVEQPLPGNVRPVDSGQFSGRGQQVTPVLALRAGTYAVTARADAVGLLVAMFVIDDLGGGPANTNYAARIIDTGRGTGTTVTVTIPEGGLYLLSIEPGGAGSLDWMLTIE